MKVKSYLMQGEMSWHDEIRGRKAKVWRARWLTMKQMGGLLATERSRQLLCYPFRCLVADEEPRCLTFVR